MKNHNKKLELKGFTSGTPGGTFLASVDPQSLYLCHEKPWGLLSRSSVSFLYARSTFIVVF